MCTGEREGDKCWNVIITPIQSEVTDDNKRVKKRQAESSTRYGGAFRELSSTSRRRIIIMIVGKEELELVNTRCYICRRGDEFDGDNGNSAQFTH